MTKQLSLIDTDSYTSCKVALMPKKARKSVTIDKEKPWKLSEEDKRQGLAGVRAIRAILQKTEHNYEYSYYKAS